MKPKTLILMAVAVSCGLVAMLGVQQAMQGNSAPVKVQTTKVLVALDNIETGMKLTADNTAFKDMPAAHVSEDAVRLEADFQDRAAKFQLMAGDVIRKSKLTEKGEWGKSVAIPPGMRVIGIPVDDSNTISGLIRPGDRVDVLVTYQGRSGRGVPVSKTKTLLEYVEVFGMDDQTASKIEDSSKGIRAKIASLILTPEQTGYVILAQRKGTLSLSWRRRGDDELAQTKDVDERLMEELEGTVGIPSGSNYELNGEVEQFSPEQEKSVALQQTAQQFLNETTAPPAATILPPAGDTWTVEIYIGNESQPQQFVLPPVDPVPEDRAALPSLEHSMVPAQRSFQIR